MPSDVLQPNPPPSPIKTMLGHKCPSATPQKIPSSSLLSQPQLSLPLKRNTHFYFSPPSLSFSTQPNYVGFIGFLVLVRVFTEKTGKARTFSFSPSLPLSLSCFSPSLLFCPPTLCPSLSFIISIAPISPGLPFRLCLLPFVASVLDLR